MPAGDGIRCRYALANVIGPDENSSIVFSGDFSFANMK